MSSNLLLAIDQGTTSSKAMLVDQAGRVIGAGSCRLSIRSPRPGWVEQDAEEIWSSVVTATGLALQRVQDAHVVGVAISNQRESVTAWRSADGRPVGPAISWQDQRGDPVCRELGSPTNRDLVRRISGLELGSMYSASKIGWFLQRFGADPTLRVGTIDSWLVDRLTGGAVYATDAGNASRTMLFDITTQSWSVELGEMFGVDVRRLPEVQSSLGPWGTTSGVPGIADGTPVYAVLGDSHAALYGHWALSPAHTGIGKVTFGTGSSIMVPVPTGTARVPGVVTTLAWQAPDPLWALEGNILYAGAGMDWLARALGVNPGVDFSQLAGSVSSSRSAVFVPALNGLGAPWWTASAVGTLTGLDAATTRAEVARAGIESVAHQVCDVVEAMDPTGAQATIHVGGGATSSELLMQTQADLLGRTLLVSRITEISALGAAALGFVGAGLDYDPAPELAARQIPPTASCNALERSARRDAWRDALRRAGVDVP